MSEQVFSFRYMFQRIMNLSYVSINICINPGRCHPRFNICKNIHECADLPCFTHCACFQNRNKFLMSNLFAPMYNWFSDLCVVFFLIGLFCYVRIIVVVDFQNPSMFDLLLFYRYFDLLYLNLYSLSHNMFIF